MFQVISNYAPLRLVSEKNRFQKKNVTDTVVYINHGKSSIGSFQLYYIMDAFVILPFTLMTATYIHIFVCFSDVIESSGRSCRGGHFYHVHCRVTVGDVQI